MVLPGTDEVDYHHGDASLQDHEPLSGLLAKPHMTFPGEEHRC
jgi:hypothetical protein